MCTKAPKTADPAHDTLALSESDEDLDSDVLEDVPLSADTDAALRRVSSAFDAKVSAALSAGLAPPSATAVPRDACLQEQRDAARAMLSKVKRALLGPFAQMIESKREEAATLEEGRNASSGALLERLSSQAKGIESELNMLSDAAGLRSVCELYSAAEDEEIEARARRNRSKA